MPQTIERIEAVPARVPTIRPHHLAFVTVEAMDVVVVRVTAGGVTGLGEAATIGGPRWGEESPEGIAAAVNHYLAEALLGQDAANLNAVEDRIARALRGNSFAKNAVSTAVHDAVARARGERLVELLGGAVVDSIPLAWTLASGDTDRDIEEGERALAERRHRHFKIKIGAGDPAQDLRHIARLAAAFEGRATLRVDINQAWDESTASQFAPALAEAGVLLFEQPLPAWNVDGMARLATRLRATVMADEGVATPQDVLRHAQAAACGAVALKPGKHGGVAGTRAVAAIARAAGLGLYGGTMLEGTIGTLGALHLYATLGHFAWGCELFGPLLLRDSLATTRPAPRDFALHLPDGPGIGTELDADKLAHYRTDRARTVLGHGAP
ncbi:muconate/chloromuconate family cycloisomerase [Roseomonas sp. NAR14]|uniref:Muconate/chloromuconate family cycloisomerase n=1 Tax=Roseomonas acroporae TaxID=2937791 RepID=A0A9X1YHJ6_9PROT|nr:muconate/chloromuconate family cycloisomerase [Roseomonas acroporae]